MKKLGQEEQLPGGLLGDLCSRQDLTRPPIIGLGGGGGGGSGGGGSGDGEWITPSSQQSSPPLDLVYKSCEFTMSGSWQFKGKPGVLVVVEDEGEGEGLEGGGEEEAAPWEKKGGKWGEGALESLEKVTKGVRDELMGSKRPRVSEEGRGWGRG